MWKIKKRYEEKGEKVKKKKKAEKNKKYKKKKKESRKIEFIVTHIFEVRLIVSNDFFWKEVMFCLNKVRKEK